MWATIEKLRMYLGSGMEEGYGSQDAGDRDRRLRVGRDRLRRGDRASACGLAEPLKLLGIRRRG